MTWRAEAPQGRESMKTRWRAVVHTRGYGLDLGCGEGKFMEGDFVIGVDSGANVHQFNIAVNAQLIMDCKDLSRFSSGAFDFVFSSHLLEHFPYKDVPGILREWVRVIRVGGNLVLYLPDEDQYPKCNEPERGIVEEPWVNKTHFWNVNYDRVVSAMERTGFNWDLIYWEKCQSDDEYSLYFCFRKLK